MGCSFTLPKKYRQIYTYERKIAKWKTQFDNLCLSELEVGKLYSIFQKVDFDGSGDVSESYIIPYICLFLICDLSWIL